MSLVQTAKGARAIRKWDGKKISRPGIYADIPMSDYHGDLCVGPSISSSGLRKIRSHSAAHFWATSPLNPKRMDEDDDGTTAAIRIGRAAHTLLLEPHLFKEQFKVRPAIWDSWRTNDSKAWRADQEKSGVTILSGDELQKITGIAESLSKHPLIGDGLLDGDLEHSLIWQDEKTGVWLKARPDAIPRGSNIFADLKCLHDARTEALERDIYSRGYDMQLALAGIGMETLLGREMEEFVLVVVENTAPHAVRIAPIAKEEIARARILLRWSINRFARCLKEGRWPAFEDDDNIHIYRRKFDADFIEKAVASGQLPEQF